LVDLAALAVHQHRRGPGRVVGPGGGRNAALAGGAGDHAGRDLRGQAADVVLVVPAVADQIVGQAAFGQRRLGGVVLFAEPDRRAIGPEDRGIGDVAHARLLRRIDHVLVLAGPLP